MSTLASVFGYGLLSARAAASVAGRFYYATDTTFVYRDNGSSWDTLSVGAGSVASDGLWDAAGDLAVGTGANTAHKLTAGTSGTFLKSAGAADPTWSYPPGYEFAYDAITGTVTITGTSEASPTTVITGSSASYDGSTAVMVELSVPRVAYTNAAAARQVVFDLYEDSTILGRIATWTPNFVSGQTSVNPIVGHFRRTPSSGSHNFVVKGWITNGSDTVIVGAGAGGTGANVPAYLRVTKV